MDASVRKALVAFANFLTFRHIGKDQIVACAQKWQDIDILAWDVSTSKDEVEARLVLASAQYESLDPNYYKKYATEQFFDDQQRARGYQGSSANAAEHSKHVHRYESREDYPLPPYQCGVTLFCGCGAAVWVHRDVPTKFSTTKQDVEVWGWLLYPGEPERTYHQGLRMAAVH